MYCDYPTSVIDIKCHVPNIINYLLQYNYQKSFSLHIFPILNLFHFLIFFIYFLIFNYTNKWHAEINPLLVFIELYELFDDNNKVLFYIGVMLRMLSRTSFCVCTLGRAVFGNIMNKNDRAINQYNVWVFKVRSFLWKISTGILWSPWFRKVFFNKQRFNFHTFTFDWPDLYGYSCRHLWYVCIYNHSIKSWL